MTAREYLNQAKWIDRRINAKIDEIQQLRRTLMSLGATNYGEHIGTPSKPAEAAFVRPLEQILVMEQDLLQEVKKLMELKREVKHTIEQIPSHNEQLVLLYHYLYGWHWDKIARSFGVDVRTVQRWHLSGLTHLAVPK